MRNKKLIFSILVSLLLVGCGDKTSKTNDEAFVTYEEETKATTNEETIAEYEDFDVIEDEESTTKDIPSTTELFVMSELDKELDLIEIDSTFLQDELVSADTTASMNDIVTKYYTLWDDELNSLWNRIAQIANKEYKAKLLEEQRIWIAQKQDASKKAASQYEKGSLRTIANTKRATELTRLRCYELATCLGELTGQTVRMPYTDYSGLFVDSQGTNEIYSDLLISKADDDFYEVEIGLYRLATLKGYATLSNGILQFVDESMDQNIKGDIIIEDDSATFIITESDWEYLFESDIFEFNEKWD